MKTRRRRIIVGILKAAGLMGLVLAAVWAYNRMGLL